MHRTGVAAGPDATERYRLISTLPGLRAAGSASDGHLAETDLATRTGLCDEAFTSVQRARDDLAKAGLPFLASRERGFPDQRGVASVQSERPFSGIGAIARSSRTSISCLPSSS